MLARLGTWVVGALRHVKLAALNCYLGAFKYLKRACMPFYYMITFSYEKLCCLFVARVVWVAMTYS